MENTDILTLTRKLGKEATNSKVFNRMKTLECEFELDSSNKELENKYIEAKLEWEELSKNIFEILEYYVGRNITKNCQSKCCSKK